MKSDLTQTAANKIYFASLVFFAWVALLSLVDIWLAPSELLMNIVPLYIGGISLSAFGLLGLLFIVRTPEKLRRYCQVFTIVGLILFVIIQLSVWGFVTLPTPLRLANPNSLALLSFMLFIFFTALATRLRFPNLVFDITRATQITLSLIIILGLSIWFALSVRVVMGETENGRTKIQLIGNMIDSRFDDQTKALERIQARVESMGLDDFEQLTKIDMERYINDYEIIKGMVVYDESLNPFVMSPFAAKFIDDGMLASSRTRQWLQGVNNETRLAASSSSLATEIPILMISVPLHLEHGTRYQLLALLDMNGLVLPAYLEYLDSFKTYMAFGNDLLISMQGFSRGATTWQELNELFPHSITENVMLNTGIAHDFHSFLIDYSPIEKATRFNQMLLWLTAAFSFIYLLAADTSKRLRSESKKLATMARYDDITGLLRRDAFNQDIEQLAIGCEGCRRAVIFVNLDNFNSINDSLGHDLGDQILAITAKRIRSAAINGDVAARFSNDEFIVYYKDTTAHKLKKDAQRTLEAIAQVFKVGDVAVHLTASLGISVTSHYSITAKSLIQRADVAMGHAKKDGGNHYVFYRQQMHDQQEQLATLRTSLQMAMEQGELEVFYQPIFCARSHQIVSVEALVRWPTADGFISPGLFIPVAEQTGQIIQLGEQVIDMVLSAIRSNSLLRGITVAINISPQQLIRSGFVESLNQRVKLNEIDSANLTFELTETVMSEASRTESVMSDLRQRGYHVAIDDFGTGFSSLSYLANQPADIIKIDRAFTIGVEEEGKERGLLKKMVEMCQQLEKIVVVEGVETQQQVDLFESFGVDRLQGFYLAKPMPLGRLIELMKED